MKSSTGISVVAKSFFIVVVGGIFLDINSHVDKKQLFGRGGVGGKLTHFFGIGEEKLTFSDIFSQFSHDFRHF